MKEWFAMVWWIISCVLIGLGTWLVWSGSKNLRMLEKYEFENRTEGGVVQFNDFEASERHENKKKWYRSLMNIGGCIVVIVLCTTMFFCGMNSY